MVQLTSHGPNVPQKGRFGDQNSRNDQQMKMCVSDDHYLCIEPIFA